MNLLLRFLRVLIHAFFRSKINIFESSEVHFRVLPHDLDLNMHMTNSRYTSVMDLGRVDRLIRSGLGKVLFKKRIGTVLGACFIRFRKSLSPFQKYTLKTKVVGVDEKWFYIEHRFESKGTLVALGMIKGVFTKRGRSIPSAEMLALLNFKPTKNELPELPRYIKKWIEMEEEIRTTTQTTR